MPTHTRVQCTVYTSEMLSKIISFLSFGAEVEKLKQMTPCVMTFGIGGE